MAVFLLSDGAQDDGAALSADDKQVFVWLAIVRSGLYLPDTR
jgi:hypothetical protein